MGSSSSKPGAGSELTSGPVGQAEVDSLRKIVAGRLNLLSGEIEKKGEAYHLAMMGTPDFIQISLIDGRGELVGRLQLKKLATGDAW